MGPTVFFWWMLQPSTACFAAMSSTPIIPWLKNQELKKWLEISGLLVLEVSFYSLQDVTAQVIQSDLFIP